MTWGSSVGRIDKTLAQGARFLDDQDLLNPRRGRYRLLPQCDGSQTQGPLMNGIFRLAPYWAALLFALLYSHAADCQTLDEDSPKSEVSVRGDAAWRRDRQMPWQPLRSGDRLELPVELVTFLDSEFHYVNGHGSLTLAPMTRATLSADAGELGLETGSVHVTGQILQRVRELSSARTLDSQTVMAMVELSEAVDLSVARQRTGGFEVTLDAGTIEHLSPSAVGPVRFIEHSGRTPLKSTDTRRDSEPYVTDVSGVLTLESNTALLQWDIWFRNPLSSTQEGVWEFSLPPSAAITACAMFVDEQTLMSGEVVERQRARAVYNSIVRRRRDPALLEELGDGRYRLSVFPIAGGGLKRILLDIRLLLTPEATGSRLELPLPSGKASPADRFDLKVQDSLLADRQEARRLSSPTHPLTLLEPTDASLEELPAGYHCADLRSSDSFVLLLDQSLESSHGDADSHTWRDEQVGLRPIAQRTFGAINFNLAAAASKESDNNRPPHESRRHAVLMCTGGSVAERQATRELTGMLIEAIPTDDRRRVGCFDNSVRWMEEWQRVSPDSTLAVRKAVESEFFVGATDLFGCLSEALDQIEAEASVEEPILWLVGTPSTNQTLDDSKNFATLNQRLTATGTRLFVLQTAPLSDFQILGQIARQTGGFHWDLTLQPKRSELFGGLMVGLETAQLGWIPDEANPAWSQWLPSNDWSGQGWMVWDSPRLAHDESVKPMLTWRPSWPPEEPPTQIEWIGPPSNLSHVNANHLAPLVVRQQLLEQDDRWRTQGRTANDDYAQAVELARRWHLVSPFTTQLVLETDADYTSRDIARTEWSPRPQTLGTLDWKTEIVRQHPRELRQLEWKSRLAVIERSLRPSLPLSMQDIDLQFTARALRSELENWTHLDPMAVEAIKRLEAWNEVHPTVEPSIPQQPLPAVRRFGQPRPFVRNEFGQLGWLPEQVDQSRWLAYPVAELITDLPSHSTPREKLILIKERTQDPRLLNVEWIYPSEAGVSSDHLFLGAFSSLQLLRWDSFGELNRELSWNPRIGFNKETEGVYPEVYNLDALTGARPKPLTQIEYLQDYVDWRLASEASVDRRLAETYSFQLDFESIDEWLSEFHRVTGLKVVLLPDFGNEFQTLPEITEPMTAHRALEVLRFRGAEEPVAYSIVEDTLVIGNDDDLEPTVVLIPVADLVPIVPIDRPIRGPANTYWNGWGGGGFGGGFGGGGMGGGMGGSFGGGSSSPTPRVSSVVPQVRVSESSGSMVQADESLEWRAPTDSPTSDEAPSIEESDVMPDTMIGLNPVLAPEGDDARNREISDGIELTSRYEFDAEPLMEMIERIVHIEEWEELGGRYRIDFDPGSASLVMYIHHSVTDEIQIVLDDLRQVPRKPDQLYIDQIATSSRHLIQDADADSIQEIIEQIVHPDDWEVLGGVGTMQWLEDRNALGVSQTSERHFEVAALLEKIKRERLKLRYGFRPRAEGWDERAAVPVLTQWSASIGPQITTPLTDQINLALTSTDESPAATTLDWPLALEEGEYRVTISHPSGAPEPLNGQEVEASGVTPLAQFDIRMTPEEFWLDTGAIEMVARGAEVSLLVADPGLAERGRWSAEALAASVEQLPWLPHLQPSLRAKLFRRLASPSTEPAQRLFRLNNVDVALPRIVWRWTPIAEEPKVWKLQIVQDDQELASYELRQIDANHLKVSLINIAGQTIAIWDMVRKADVAPRADSFDERFAQVPCIDWITAGVSPATLPEGIWALQSKRADAWLEEVLRLTSPDEVDWPTAWIVALALHQRDPKEVEAQRPWVAAVLAVRPDLYLDLARSLEAPLLVRQVLLDSFAAEARNENQNLQLARLSDAAGDAPAALKAYQQAAAVGDWFAWSDQEKFRYLALLLSNHAGDQFDVQASAWYESTPGDFRFKQIETLLADADEWNRQATWILSHLEDSRLSREVIQQSLLNAPQMDPEKLIRALCDQLAQTPNSRLASEMRMQISLVIGDSKTLINEPDWNQWIVDAEFRAELERTHVLLLRDSERILAILDELPQSELNNSEFERLIGAHASLSHHEEIIRRVVAWLSQDKPMSFPLQSQMIESLGEQGRDDEAQRFRSDMVTRRPR